MKLRTSVIIRKLLEGFRNKCLGPWSQFPLQIPWKQRSPCAPWFTYCRVQQCWWGWVTAQGGVLATASLDHGSCCSLAKSCPTLCDPTGCSKPGFPVPHHLPEFAQVHVHWISDAIPPSRPLSPSSPSVFNISKHQGLFQWVGSSHQVTKVSELQL